MQQHMFEDSEPEPRNINSITNDAVSHIASLYTSDNTPWIVGFSGGKDSTALLQLVWLAIESIPKPNRTKTIHVISTDTLVENPIIANHAQTALNAIERASNTKGLPFQVHRLTPEIDQSFWVRLIGWGYAAPRQMFRWCTERLKIKPSNTFIESINAQGGSIVALGTRKAESVARRARMEAMEEHRERNMLSPNASLTNSLVFTPIEDWTTSEVWVFLMQFPSPWGMNNKALLTLYQGASQDEECPLVVDKGTPSCGQSRFGCWVCTLVQGDTTLTALAENTGHEWLRPLLDFRRKHLEVRDDDGFWNDRHLRDFRRSNGPAQIYRRNVTTTQSAPSGRTFKSRSTHLDTIPGPYTQQTRRNMLHDLLKAQAEAQSLLEDESSTWDIKPEWAKTWSIITQKELHAIREVWVFGLGEIEDYLPRIYTEALGQAYTGQPITQIGCHIKAALKAFRCMSSDEDGDALYRYEMFRNLLAQEWMRANGDTERAEKLLRRTHKRQALLGEKHAIEQAHARFELKEALRNEHQQVRLDLETEVDNAPASVVKGLIKELGKSKL